MLGHNDTNAKHIESMENSSDHLKAVWNEVQWILTVSLERFEMLDSITKAILAFEMKSSCEKTGLANAAAYLSMDGQNLIYESKKRLASLLAIKFE